MLSSIEINRNKLVKQSFIIESLYGEINIKKALVICNKSDIEINKLANILDSYDHSVSTIDSINKFLNNEDSKLLIISSENFELYRDLFLSDSAIDTIFLINYKLNNNICDLFYEKIIVFDLTL